MKEEFLLDPNITYLNFGSFGACPKPVFEAYQQLQLQLEQSPVQFIVHSGMDLLKASRHSLSLYLGCASDDLVLMTNPSYAINTVAKSIPLNVGDEVLTTSLEYGAMDRTWEYYCKKSGAKYRQSKINFPIESKASFLKDFWSGYNENTKVVFISHITSATALILPIEEICLEAKRLGLLTIIDGAHAPGQLPLNIDELNPDVYVGACHKWMMAPKGASFLYVKKSQQHWVDPLLISWGYQSDAPSHSIFLDYHETAGTRDFSAFLAVPYCIDFMNKYDWVEKRSFCQAKTLEWAKIFQGYFEFKSIAPIDAAFIGQMYSIPIETEDMAGLKSLIYERFHIEVPVFTSNSQVFIRFSFQVFNSDEDMQRLFDAMKTLNEEGYFKIKTFV
ncbi:MAG: aminotransferase [Cryomorphaceae bacterium]|nr:aminotransferase [Cryomorphaceae bacterium]|tara:strand:- start:7540 stop:8706 length:1167 start_codon:yes stop_codon:yes gene_type:complete